MITFGYKSSLSSNLRAYAAICMGMVLLPGTEGSNAVVRIIAGLLCAVGVMSFLSGLGSGKKGYFILMCLNALVDIIIGVILAFFPILLIDGVIIFLASCLVVLGVLELIVAISTRRLSGINTFGLALCALVLIGGAVLFAVYFLANEGVVLTCTGVVLLIYGISELILAWRVSKAVKAAMAEDFAAETNTYTQISQGEQQ